MTKLTNFALNNAEILSGPLPHAWNGILHFQAFSLVVSNVIGTLPESWSSMTNLKNLTLFDN